MRWLLLVGLFGFLSASVADAGPKSKTYKVVRFVTAEKVGFDGRGVCVAKKNQSKVYYFKDFPAKVDMLQSCITLIAESVQGRKDFLMEVLDREGNTLLEMDGLLDFGAHGRVSQVVEWDEMEVMAAGKYDIVVSIEDEEVVRHTIQFGKRGR